MTAKEVRFRAEARERLLHGVRALADAMCVTLGPKSKSVLIERKWGKPLVCNDGVTIAKEFELKDPQANLGAQMIREAAERTGEAVGDGTTTATLLAAEIFAAGMQNVAAGASAVDLRRGLEKGRKLVVERLRQLSRPVESTKERAQVATISAHNDPELGDLVADAMERVGREGVVSVEEAKGTDTVLEVVEGMQFDRGYISPYFVTDTSKMEAVLERPWILVYDKRIAALADILPVLERISKSGRPLLVVAEDVEGEALATMVVNKLRGTFQCLAVKAPGFGDRRKAMLQDLAIVTGGQFVAEELGVELANVTEEHLGEAERVIAGKDQTTVVGGGGTREAIEARCDELKKALERETSDYERDKLHERLAKLAGGVAVIRVGAPSESEMKARREALEDAVAATKAATEEGIVPGGGWALLQSIAPLEQLERELEGDERAGVRILARALERPTRQIAENSSLDGGVVVERMRHGEGAHGLDAAVGRYVDLFAAGIVDPTKVVRVALDNAVSVASLLLLTEATLTEEPEPEKRPEAGPPADLY